MLGEHAGGKSTAINAFRNCLNYSSLKDAELGQGPPLIPTKFTTYDETFQKIEVTCGNTDDPNEVQNEGQSTTQRSRIYSIQDGTTLIRLIDTPGFGTDDDEKNFDNVLSTICQRKEIHAICIFLKPDSSKVKQTFLFCIKKLKKLPKASNNIIFCFSNTRTTMYRPGDALAELDALLKEYKEADINITTSKHDVFCLDNEAERFLASIQNDPPLLFTDVEHENYSKAWEKSTEEIKNLLEYVKDLAPCQIPEKLMLDQARDLASKIIRPVAENIRMLETNKSIAESDRKRIEKCDEEIEALTKIQVSPSVWNKIRKLAHPKTVCSNTNCVKKVEQDGITTIEYVKVCHGKCKLNPVDSVGHPRLKKCVAFRDGGGECKECGHSFEEHLHIYYDSTQVVQQVLKDSPEKGITPAELKRRMIEERNLMISEYECELEKSLKAAVEISHFVKVTEPKNRSKVAEGAYKDGVEMFMKQWIREEEQIKTKSGQNRIILESLTRSLLSYKNARTALENRARGGASPNPKAPANVQNLAKELTKLKHSGKALQDSLQCFNYDANVFAETVLISPKQKFELNLLEEE